MHSIKEDVFFITGLSGAGRSQVLRFLEDIGFFCIDNLPPLLIDKLLSVAGSSSLRDRKIAMGIDIRSREFFDGFHSVLTILKQKGVRYRLLFIDAHDEVLVKRFGETRREHPLVGEGSLLEKIGRERELLVEFKTMADDVIDTSETTSKELWSMLRGMFLADIKDSFYVNLISFGFKYGVPISSNLVFDVRFIPNPFYLPGLGGQNGNDDGVKDYVMGHRVVRKFIKSIFSMIVYLVPHYQSEGKNSLEIAFGCTGGQHRSVAIANQLRLLLSDRFRANVFHRDLEGDDGSHEKNKRH
ncbi:MAG: RNase adapter RapZ [Candidatus Wallbacteria bacterium]|nr:RNase adapter RapZ [Candidatus Wallbacteria bacterium]